LLHLTPDARRHLAQEEGEFVVTFPGAYHGGVNLGLNCAEAVNFAPADWLRFGAESCARYRMHRKPSLLCYEWLVLKVGACFANRMVQNLFKEQERGQAERSR